MHHDVRGGAVSAVAFCVTDDDAAARVKLAGPGFDVGMRLYFEL